ncbi:MAG: hypothetical protein QM541_05290 [Flavobacterium sp.]|nr:hypothetical protein [Flavobacterium sp.]
MGTHKVIAQYPKDTIKFNDAYGSAKALKGKVHVINVFVSDDKLGWNAQDKELVLNEQDYAFRWIQRQAQTFLSNANLTFTTTNIGLDKDVKVHNIYTSRNPKFQYPVSIWALYWAGYRAFDNFYDSVKLANTADNILVMVFAKKAGRSFAQHAFNDNQKNPFFLEGVIVYSDTYRGSGLAIGTIVHEMLHLFGAWDIYFSSSQTAEVEKNARAIFPNSIMLDSNKKITGLMIDKMTAWCVGLTNVYLGWYDFFKPRFNKDDYKIVQPRISDKN